jgi:hypothetical protein
MDHRGPRHGVPSINPGLCLTGVPAIRPPRDFVHVAEARNRERASEREREREREREGEGGGEGGARRWIIY